MEDKQKVLIIDDSPLTVKILRNMLKGDYDVISAFSGIDGLKIAQTKNPDIIVLDVLMTGMDGYEVCRKLKSNTITKDIPVIFVTALGDMDDERKGLEIGAIDYISKPFSEPIVKIRIKNHLELKRTRDFLSKLSTLDGITGLHNRRYFDEVYEKEWNMAVANKAPLSLMLIDIDKFKVYNDNYGHLEGDECLKLVADRIKECANDGDIVARFGGEEFINIMPNTEYEHALIKANKTLTGVYDLKVPFAFSSVADVVTVSIGLASIYPNENVISSDFLKNVDDLLYKAKHNGRNQIQFKKF